MSEKFNCFSRTWWAVNKDWPGGLEPSAGRKSRAGHPQGVTEDEARRHCRAWNETHAPGKLSRKAEFESAGDVRAVSRRAARYIKNPNSPTGHLIPVGRRGQSLLP